MIKAGDLNVGQSIPFTCKPILFLFLLCLLAMGFTQTEISTGGTGCQGKRRSLAMDITQSTVTGTGLVTLEAFVTATVTVVAKDASGNLVGSGGETIKVELHNQ